MEELRKKDSFDFQDWKIRIPKLNQSSNGCLTNCDLMKMSSQLLSSCQQPGNYIGNPQARLSCNMGSSQFNQSFMFKKSASKLPAYVFDPSQPNPQEKEQIDKYFNKLKVKCNKNGKVSMIRKSQLGQNQMVFTQTEEMKLAVIDQFLEKGFNLPSDLYQIELKPDPKNMCSIQTPIDHQNKENIYKEEIKRMEKWGQEGNKKNILENLSDSLHQYIQSTNLQAKIPHKMHKKQVKTLNFSIRNKPQKFSGIRDSVKIRRSRRETKTEKCNDKMKATGTRIICEFQTQNFLECTSNKKFSSELPRTIDKKMGENIMRCMNRKDQICQLKRYLIKKYMNIPQTDYMTIQRKQALFECEMIKGVKQIMNFKDYQELQFIRESEDSQATSKDGKQYFFSNQPHQDNDESDIYTNKQQQVEKELQKNRMRLKLERQRIIEKLRC